MIVKCIAVPRKRTPKKVEVILSRVSPAKKTVIKLKARVAEPDLTEYEEIFLYDDDDYQGEIGDNLDGIIPIDEYSAEEADEGITVEDLEDAVCEADEADAEDIFNAFAAYDLEEEYTPSISEIEADLEELENDLRTQLGDEDTDDEEFPELFDNSIVQRHFVRDNEGSLFESDSESAEGHEVACYDKLGKLKRACGVIRKGQPVVSSSEPEDVFSMAVSDMFSESN